jgi:hypothetical protein
MQAQPRRWSYSLSHLFLLILSVAIAFGWWRDHRQLAETLAQRELRIRTHEVWLKDERAVRKADTLALRTELEIQKQLAVQQFANLQFEWEKERRELLAKIQDLTQ